MEMNPKFLSNYGKLQEKSDNHHWTPEQEKLLKMWAEKASGYRWMHSRAEKHFDKLSKLIGIPLIFLNTIAGTTLFSTMDSDYSKYFQIGVGITTMFTTILAGIQNFLGLGKLSEKHRAASSLFSNYVRDIAAELSLPPYERVDAREYVKFCRKNYGKLIHESPPVPDIIIRDFNETFKNKYKKLHRPSITNGLTEVQIYNVKETINNPNYSVQSTPRPELLNAGVKLEDRRNFSYNSLSSLESKKNINRTSKLDEVIIKLDNIELTNIKGENNPITIEYPQLPTSPNSPISPDTSDS